MDCVENENNDEFYIDAAEYWQKIPPTIDGMLGGFGFISQTDIQGSRLFLQKLFKLKNPPGKNHALDCGAGIGRITKKLLLEQFNCVDLVEQNPKFLDKVQNFVGNTNKHKLGTLYCSGLQNFTPEINKYDVIWCQWVLGHLRDDHFINFFTNCAKGLKKNGIIVVKENITSTGKVETDEGDSSVTRPLILLKELFKKSFLEIIQETEQNNFPKGLYLVKMFALKPILSSPEFIVN